MPEREKEVMKLFVIQGEMNSGKTHTAWLVLIKLLASWKGANVEITPKREIVSEQDVIDDIIQSKGDPKKAKLHDFRAFLTYADRKVAIVSAGDSLKNKWKFISFLANMEWAEEKEVDELVCSCRLRNRKGSVCWYIRENYKASVYKWYKKLKCKKDIEKQIQDAQKVSDEIVRDIE